MVPKLIGKCLMVPKLIEKRYNGTKVNRNML